MFRDYLLSSLAWRPFFVSKVVSTLYVYGRSSRYCSLQPKLSQYVLVLLTFIIAPGWSIAFSAAVGYAIIAGKFFYCDIDPVPLVLYKRIIIANP